MLALTGDTGLHAASATGACATATCTRALNSTTNYLSYEIYTDSGHSTVWNATNSIPLTTTGVSQSVTIYGYIPAGNVQPAGSYSDTVTITATY